MKGIQQCEMKVICSLYEEKGGFNVKRWDESGRKDRKVVVMNKLANCKV